MVKMYQAPCLTVFMVTALLTSIIPMITLCFMNWYISDRNAESQPISNMARNLDFTERTSSGMLPHDPYAPLQCTNAESFTEFEVCFVGLQYQYDVRDTHSPTRAYTLSLWNKKCELIDEKEEVPVATQHISFSGVIPGIVDVNVGDVTIEGNRFTVKYDTGTWALNDKKLKPYQKLYTIFWDKSADRYGPTSSKAVYIMVPFNCGNHPKPSTVSAPKEAVEPAPHGHYRRDDGNSKDLDDISREAEQKPVVAHIDVSGQVSRDSSTSQQIPRH